MGFVVVEGLPTWVSAVVEGLPTCGLGGGGAGSAFLQSWPSTYGIGDGGYTACLQLWLGRTYCLPVILAVVESLPTRNLDGDGILPTCGLGSGG